MVEERPADTGNPFAPPKAEAAAGLASRISGRRRGRGALAPRRLRLLAALFDGFLWVPAMVLNFLADASDEHSLARFGWYVGLGVYAVALLAWNALWLHRSGQSIGKRVLGIAIVRSDGAPAGFGRIAALRIAPLLVLDFAPVIATRVWGIDAEWLSNVSMLVGLVDTLFIFGPRSRCLHDWLADTIVVEARELPRELPPRAARR
jgi:uncharacterized RDD family membrane protein YckC